MATIHCVYDHVSVIRNLQRKRLHPLLQRVKMSERWWWWCNGFTVQTMSPFSVSFSVWFLKILLKPVQLAILFKHSFLLHLSRPSLQNKHKVEEWNDKYRAPLFPVLCPLEASWQKTHQAAQTNCWNLLSSTKLLGRKGKQSARFDGKPPESLIELESGSSTLCWKLDYEITPFLQSCQIFW